jgi:taurine dioxygenase
MNSKDTFHVLGLYGLAVEEPTAPTMFVSNVRGWETLPDDLRALVENKSATHGEDAYGKRGGENDLSVARPDNSGSIRLPIAHRHPRTGKTLLYVSQLMTSKIDGLTEDESEALLSRLFDHLYADNNVVEHHWREHDLVLWDNLALQHARPNVTAEGPVRTLRKTSAPRPPWAHDNASQSP